METVKPRLSRETLRWARVESGFETEEVAKSAGVSADRYVQWEAGADFPTFRQLRQVANKLKRPLAMFYLLKPPAEAPMPADFRTVAQADNSRYSPELRLEIRKAERTQLLFAALSEDLGLSGAPNIPQASRNDNPEEVGQRLRSFLGISIKEQVSFGDPGNLYREWRDAVFSRGILPLQFGVSRDQALGFALWHDFAPLVAVNTRESPEAKLFTLFHELSHIAIRAPGVSDASIPFREVPSGPKAEVEAFCNQSAAAALLPEDSSEVQSALKTISQGKDIDLQVVRLQARKLGVSKYTLVYRLASLRPEQNARVQATVSAWFAIDTAAQKGKKKSKGGPTPALTTMGKRGRGFVKTVLKAVRESRLSLDDARDLLDLEPHHFQKLEEVAFKGANEEDE